MLAQFLKGLSPSWWVWHHYSCGVLRQQLFTQLGAVRKVRLERGVGMNTFQRPPHINLLLPTKPYLKALQKDHTLETESSKYEPDQGGRGALYSNHSSLDILEEKF